MHIPRFICVAWIIVSLSPKPPSYSRFRALSERASVHLEAAEVEPEVDDLEPGGPHGGRDLLASPRHRPDEDHASPAGAAHLGRAAFRSRGGDDLLDLRV